ASSRPARTTTRRLVPRAPMISIIISQPEMPRSPKRGIGLSHDRVSRCGHNLQYAGPIAVHRISVVALLVVFAALGGAQSTSASLSGRITDPSNALIADAIVAAIAADTNFRYETTTTGSG